MQVKQLRLQNYGYFKDLSISFAPTDEKQSNVTVIIGNNGAGKSLIINGLSTALNFFLMKFKTWNHTSDFFKEKYIKNKANSTCIDVLCSCPQINNPNTKWRYSVSREGKENFFGNQKLTLKQEDRINSIAELYKREYSKNNHLSLPILATYQTNRGDLEDNFVAYSTDQEYTQMDAYNDLLQGYNTDLHDFLEWFRRTEDIENENYKNSIQLSISEKLESLKSLVSVLDKNSKSSLIEEIDNLYDDVSDINVSKDSNIQILKHITEAIVRFTNFKNPRIRRQGKPTMIVEKDGEELDVNQLSQGEKSLLALVGDIARRLAILNPSLDNPLEGEGIVMIDEVDLHLHPKWQHDLIDKLVKTFPNVQFILTTHSPHIISDRSDILVYALDDGNLTQVDNIYGEDVNSVLTKVFDVPIRDREAQKAFDDVAELIVNHEFDKAEKQIFVLEKQMPQNLELLRCRLHLTKTKARMAKSK